MQNQARPRLAANLSMLFSELPFEQRFAAATAAGFRGVEYLFPYALPAPAVVALQAEADVETVLFNLPPGDFAAGERGLAALPGREAEFRRGVALALDYAEALAVPRLHAMAGLMAAGADRATYVSNLAWAAEALGRTGRELLIEPINRRDMPGYFLADWDAALAVIAEIGAPNLKLQADIYHLQILHGDVTRRLEAVADRIGHVQIAGVPDRHEPDGGELNLHHLFATLDRIGYQGWIGCEYRPRGETVAGLDWAADWLG